MAALLWVSGAGWLVSHYLFPHRSEFGDLPNPWEPVWMRLHGAAVMMFLVAFGALLPGHIMRGLRRRTNSATGTLALTTGTLMLTMIAALTLTGYGLYYAGDESLRSWTGIVHWAVGLAAAAGLVAHAAVGRRRRTLTRGRHALDSTPAATCGR